MTSVGLVIPVYNERDRLGEHLAAIEAWAGAVPGRSVTFVDDGSDDGTADILEQAVCGWATVLRRPHRGKGAAVSAGLAEVAGEVLAFCDVDLSTPLEDLDLLLGLAERVPVLAVGSRDVLGARLEAPEGRVRETLGRTYNRLVQLLLTPGVLDTQCGAKAARRSVWERILPHCSEDGFAWDAEAVAVALHLGIHVREVGVRWRHDPRTRVKVLRDGLRMGTAAVRIAGRVRRVTPIGDARRPVPGSARHCDVDLQHADGPPIHWWYRSRAALVASTLRRLGRRGGGWLVDVGAGTGATTALLGWDPDTTIAVDPDARVATMSSRLGHPTVRARAPRLPLADGMARVVVLLDVLEHDPSPIDVLCDVARVLHADGVAVILVPAHRWLWSAHDLRVGHLRRYSRADLRAELEGAGLEVTFIGGVMWWAVPALVAVRKVLRRPVTGLAPAPWVADRAALALTSIERHLLGRMRVPFGASLMAVARSARREDGPAGPDRLDRRPGGPLR